LQPLIDGKAKPYQVKQARSKIQASQGIKDV